MHLPNIKCSEAKVIVSIDDTKRVLSAVKRHTFIRMITVLSTAKLPQLPSSISGAVYYRCRLSLSDSLDALLSHLSTGRLRILSCASLPSEDCFCVEAGVLTMSLTKSTYQSAGLDGRPSSVLKGKWTIISDMSAPGFGSNKSLQRFRKAFAAIAFKGEVLCSFDDGVTCPRELETVLGQPLMTQRSERSELLAVPLDITALARLSSSSEDFEELQEDVHTHLTLLSQGQHISQDSNAFFSVYTGPQPQALLETRIIQLSGFFSPSMAELLISCMRSEVDHRPALTFTQMTGFEETPTAWHGLEHGSVLGGENVVSILQCTEGECRSQFMWEVLCQSDEAS